MSSLRVVSGAGNLSDSLTKDMLQRESGTDDHPQHTDEIDKEGKARDRVGRR